MSDNDILSPVSKCTDSDCINANIPFVTVSLTRARDDRASHTTLPPTTITTTATTATTTTTTLSGAEACHKGIGAALFLEQRSCSCLAASCGIGKPPGLEAVPFMYSAEEGTSFGLLCHAGHADASSKADTARASQEKTDNCKTETYSY